MNSWKGNSLEARETNLALDNFKAQIIKHHQRISKNTINHNKAFQLFQFQLRFKGSVMFHPPPIKHL